MILKIPCLFLILFSVVSVCYSQIINMPIDKSYGFSKKDIAKSISYNGNNGFIIAGTSQSAQSDDDAWVINLNSNGDSLWSRKYSGSGEEGFNSILNLNQGGFLLSGVNSTIDRNHFKDGWFLFLDTNGDTTRTKLYGGDYNDEIIKTIKLKENGFIAIGNYEGQYAYKTKLWIMKLDSKGDTVWTRIYGDSICKASDIIELDDQSFLILA